MTYPQLRKAKSSYHRRHLAQIVVDEDGQDVAEYGLLVAGVGVLVLAASTSLGVNLHAWFDVLANRITSQLGE